MPQYTLLAIETSCDETAAAVVRGREVLSNVLRSQLEHQRYGGVVPELAARAHLQSIIPIVREALQQAGLGIEQLDALAVTTEPGLIGSLLVGVNFAKGLALRWNLPLVPVNHLEGHMFSGFLEAEPPEFPFLALVVSGGHTALFWVRSFAEYSLLGSTRDDAAGEAFDKIATLLGLGYPGGPAIDRCAMREIHRRSPSRAHCSTTPATISASAA
jgi:N6-L-threonylcarbamoyladenine synthase